MRRHPRPTGKDLEVITGIAHTCYVVKDLDASIAFYRDRLGMTPAFDFINEKGERFGIYLHVGGRTFIELFVGDLAERAPKQSYQHLCLEVEDFDGTVAELRSRGVEVTNVKLGTDHSWQCWIKDPDGNGMELHGYTAESKQGPWLR
jgi:catechol 2,3-dioxygenase-like lactoylglutathione lyase family enzyme